MRNIPPLLLRFRYVPSSLKLVKICAAILIYFLLEGCEFIFTHSSVSYFLLNPKVSTNFYLYDNTIGCCARKILSLQYDFLHLKGKLHEMIEAMGHAVLFYPKFHCELNWIEYYWRQVKRYTRDNCKYNYEGLKAVSSFQI